MLQTVNVVETAVIHVPVGIGDPFFDSVESVLSHLLYSVPAVKRRFVWGGL